MLQSRLELSTADNIGAIAMLVDPEHFEEWEDDVWAGSESEAWQKCQLMAEEAQGTEVINVTQQTKKQSKNGTYKYTCWFRSEVNPNDNSDR